MLTFADILEALLSFHPAWATQVITEAVIDSRQAVSGALFIALPGERLDGHDFVTDAFNRGAYLAIVQKDPSKAGQPLALLDLRDRESAATYVSHPDFIPPGDGPLCLLVEDSLAALQHIAAFWRRKFDVRVIGITGSVGKSTTKEVVCEVLSRRYLTLKSPGNYNNEIGLPLTLLKLSRSHERVVLEMGFYIPGEIRFLCDLALPQVGVITNVGVVHAERAGSLEAIAQGKAELVEALPADGVAILNYDDLWVRNMADKTRASVLFYGTDPKADLWADHIEGLGLEGIRFRLHYKDEVLYLRVPLIGRHSVHTALRAAAVGLVEGLTWQEIVEGLRSEKTQLRLVAVRTENGALLLDDTYNASPESTLAALNLLDELGGRKVAVLGDMLELGPYEHEGHEIVGARAAEVAQELICVGERAHIIADSARARGLAPEKIMEFEEIQPVIDYLQPRLESSDVVLVKGSRGLRMDRIVASLEHRI
jgi:UDP-N-acetylmuramoyl-tripeptide--D-alanyl-D-alanine ligase